MNKLTVYEDRFRLHYPPDWMEDSIPCKRCGVVHTGTVVVGIKTAKGRRVMVLMSLCSSCLAQVAYERLKALTREGEKRVDVHLP